MEQQANDGRPSSTVLAKRPFMATIMAMNDLETIVRKLIREEIHAALEEMLPRLQRLNSTKPSEPEDGMLLSTREAAKRLAISERTLFALTQSGQLPCVRVGTAKRYSVETLRQWIRGV
jgi:excisionase family DNA binding protein